MAKARYKQMDWQLFETKYERMLYQIKVQSKGEKRFFTGRRKASKELDLRPPPKVV